jgi:hypothetical protein
MDVSKIEEIFLNELPLYGNIVINGEKRTGKTTLVNELIQHLTDDKTIIDKNITNWNSYIKTLAYKRKHGVREHHILIIDENYINWRENHIQFLYLNGRHFYITTIFTVDNYTLCNMPINLRVNVDYIFTSNINNQVLKNSFLIPELHKLQFKKNQFLVIYSHKYPFKYYLYNGYIKYAIKIQRWFRQYLSIQKAKKELMRRQICREIKCMPGKGIFYFKALNHFNSHK